MSSLDNATRTSVRDPAWANLQDAVKSWTNSTGLQNTGERRRDEWLRCVQSAYNTRAVRPDDGPKFEPTWLLELERLGEGWLSMASRDVKTSKKHKVPESDHIAAQRRATWNSWRAPYYGDAHESLLRELRSLADSPTYPHPRFLPIVQSSGTGKSRMVDESSKHLFTIPMCTRSEHVLAMPPADHDVRDFMACNLTVQGERAGPRTHWTLFFLALFETLTNSRTLLDPNNCSPAAWRTRFTEHMDLDEHNDFRTQFFESVVAAAIKKASALSLDDKVSKIEDRLGTAATEALQKLTEAYNTHPAQGPTAVGGNHGLILNIVFDEAHTVFPDQEDGAAKLAGFRSALRKCIHLPVVCTLLTTSSALLPMFCPPRTMSPTLDTPDLFHQTGWDHMHACPTPRSGHELLEFESMVAYGRPLWASRYLHGPKSRLSQSEVVEFALVKLLNTSQWEVSSSGRVPDAQLLALLGSLVPLALSNENRPAHVLFGIQSTLVERHLGVLADYQPDLRLMDVSRPSEPILALAALSALQYLLCSVLKLFTGVKSTLLLSRGELGELLVMLMFVIAHCRAALKLTVEEDPLHRDQLHPSTMIRPTPARLLMEQLLRCDPQQAKRVADFSSKMGSLRLFQFIRIEENALPSEKQMMCAYQRGCGFASFPHQRGTYLIIPTSNGGAILVEVRNRSKFTAQEQAEAHKRLSESRQAMAHLSSRPCIQLLFNTGSNPSKGTPSIEVADTYDESGAANQSFLMVTVNGLDALALLEDRPVDSALHWFGTASEAQEMLQYSNKSPQTQKRDQMNKRMAPLAGPGQEYLSFCRRQVDAADELDSDTDMGR